MGGSCHSAHVLETGRLSEVCSLHRVGLEDAIPIFRLLSKCIYLSSRLTSPTAHFMDTRKYSKYIILQEAFEFKKPIRPASRGCLNAHVHEESKDPFTHRQNSAPARMVRVLAFMLGVHHGKRNYNMACACVVSA